MDNYHSFQQHLNTVPRASACKGRAWSQRAYTLQGTPGTGLMPGGEATLGHKFHREGESGDGHSNFRIKFWRCYFGGMQLSEELNIKDKLLFLNSQIQQYNENERLWYLKRESLLSLFKPLITLSWWFSWCWAKIATLEGYRGAFKGPYDSTTALQHPCSVTKRTLTNSRESAQLGGVCAGHSV